MRAAKEPAAVRNALETFEQAAVLCLEKEGIDPDNELEISLSFVSMEEIHRLNKMYEGGQSYRRAVLPSIEDFNEIDWEDEEEETAAGRCGDLQGAGAETG